MEQYLTLIDIFQDRRGQAEKGITYISGDRDELYESYGELFEHALQALHYLQSRGMEPGDELLMQIDENRTFLHVFWGCLLGGIVPVPVTVGSNDEHKMKLFKIWDTLRRPYLISDAKVLGSLEKYARQQGLEQAFGVLAQKALPTESLDYGSEAKGIIYPVEPDRLAFIQFSSGSTGDPKGVMLTHENLVHNIRDAAAESELDDNDAYLGWMPLTHDLGLIAFHLTCVIGNVNQFIMPTALFIRRPSLWLKKASEHRVTLICSPNFGYKFFLDQYKPEAAKDWDLSRIRIIYNGAEPISTEVCDRFLSAMAVHGLRRSAMFCVYGMAEACVGVAHPPLNEGIKAVHLNREHLTIGEAVVPVAPEERCCVTFVDVGYPMASCDFRICDDNHLPLPDDVIGHIQIRGKNVTSGYYNNPQATAKAMTKDGWLVTGDLGFMRSGRLIITGRAKDIIFVNGQNVYPHDMERVAEEVDGVELGKVAVCGVRDPGTGQDRIVLFVIYTKKPENFVPLIVKLRHHLNERGGWEVRDVVPVRRLPKTTSGKVQRYKLAQQYMAGEYDEVSGRLAGLLLAARAAKPKALARSEAEQKLLALCKRVLQTEEIGTDESYFELGANSLQLTQLAEALEGEFGKPIPVTDFFSYPTIAKLAAHLAADPAQKASVKLEAGPMDDPGDRDIAIIGMAGKFPQADTLEQFWEHAAQGHDAIGPYGDARKRDADVFMAKLQREPGQWEAVEGGYLDEIDTFDYAFFKLTPREASLMDPNQRLFLQTAWSALEDAGYVGAKMAGARTGVYVGFSKTSFDYERLLTEAEPEALPRFIIGNLPSVISSRIAYLLDLKGPAVTVDTACSSSLSAVHLACRALMNGDCDMAVAGGVKTILLPIRAGIGMESADGRARAFDRESDGTGAGEGVGAVILKPLRRAVQDGDRIVAVIKGSAMNQDGSTIGISAPNALAQADVIAQAWRNARVDPETITYIEAHGTGTQLGDPVEIEGISQAFGRYTERKQFCAVSTVKTNIGHLYEAAGIAGLIKAVLSLRHRQIAPLVHFRAPNRQIRFEDSPVYPNVSLTDWEPQGFPRRCGVSSFGFSGTNCHVVLEEYKPREETAEAGAGSADGTAPDGALLLVLSARTDSALKALIGRYAERFERSPDLDIRSVCFTASTGRSMFAHRLAIAAANPVALRDSLLRLHREGIADEGVFSGQIGTVSGYGEPAREVPGGPEAAGRFSAGEGGAAPTLETAEGAARLAEAFVRGEPIDWEQLYAQGQRQRVSLPSYPFEGKRCWIQIAETPQRRREETGSLTMEEGQVNGVSTLHEQLSHAGAAADSARHSEVAQTLAQMISDVSHLEMNELHPHTHFLELGLDSINLTQVRQGIKDVFGLDIPMSRFFENLTSLEQVAEYIVHHLPHNASSGTQNGIDRSGRPTGDAVPHRAEVLSAAAGQGGPTEGVTTFLPISAAPRQDRQAAHDIHAGSAAASSLGQAAVAAHVRSGRTPADAERRGIEAQPGWDGPPSAEALRQTAPDPTGGWHHAPSIAFVHALRPIMEQQLHIIARQLDVLQPPSFVAPESPERAAGTEPPAFPAAVPHAHSVDARSEAAAAGGSPYVAAPSTVSGGDHGTSGDSSEPTRAVAADSEGGQPFRPYRPIDVKARETLPLRQEQHLRDLIDRYTARTGQTKAYTQKYRAVYANNRNVAGFRLVLKEMVYQLVAERAEGSKIWDLDGNEYIDLTMGFGVNLFGHDPAFIREHIDKALRSGMCLGPMSNLAGQVAEGICRMTGVERIALFNSGTEAVMVALRLARAATGRSKVVLFAGSYHGTFDGVLALARPGGDRERSMPLAPGVPAGMVDDIVVLPYGTETALAYIREHAHELAAVLVEPVQSRRPDLQPRPFLAAVREATEQAGAALIFDEVITGFRLHPGGAQAWFGIEADLVTYGKVIGGGLPIGIVGGRAAFMDGIDGGMWDFGDGSYPQNEERRTFVAGTFCHHPLAMAASLAVLERLERDGEKLQAELNARTADLAETLNRFFTEEKVPIRIDYFGSLFRFVLKGDLELFYYHMLDQGIYIWEGRNCFLSTAHTETDIARIVQAVKNSVAALRHGGFLPDSPPDGPDPGKLPLPERPVHDQDIVIPLTPEQKQLWFASASSRENSHVLHESALIRLRGPLRLQAWSESVHTLMLRHEALRTYMGVDGETQVIAASLEAQIKLLDVSGYDDLSRERQKSAWLKQGIEDPFGLSEREPLFRIRFLKLEEEEHLALFTFHHLIADGWSIVVFMRELASIYSALVRKERYRLPEAALFRDYAAWQRLRMADPRSAEASAFWTGELSGPLSVLELPSPFRGVTVPGLQGGRYTAVLEGGLVQSLKTLSIQLGSSLFVTLLSGFKILLHRLTGDSGLTVGVPTAGQAQMDAFSLMGHCVNVLPVVSRIQHETTFEDFAGAVKESMRRLEAYQAYSFAALAEQGLRHLPVINVVFNMDRPLPKLRFHELDTELLPSPVTASKYELFVNVTEANKELRVDFDYNAGLFEPDVIAHWFRYWVTILDEITKKSGQPLAEISLLGMDETRQIYKHWSSLADRDGGCPCVLDAFGRPAPAGTAGELHIVAQGLLNPQSMREAARTGEWVYHAPGGELKRIGPISAFARIRGRLINLRQLETHLLHVCNLEACAFRVWEDSAAGGAATLTAYVVPDPSAPWEEEALKRRWSEALPDYAQPGQVMLMKALPLLADGEPDWERLPAPSMPGADLMPEMGAGPDDGVEAELIRMWQEVLGVSTVCAHDPFFQLGGDSLTATVLLSRIRKTFGVQIPLGELFHRQTVGSLAQYIRGGEKQAFSPIEPVEAHPHYPASPGQRRMYLLQQQEGGTTYNVSGCLHLEGDLRVPNFIEALQEAAGRHESLRTCLKLEGGEVVQAIQPELVLHVPVTQAEASELEAIFRRFIRPFRLEEAPLIRAELLDFGNRRYALLVDVHHAAADGFSMAALLDEVLQAYQGRQLKPVRVQYKDFAAWQRRQLAQGTYREQEAYWLQTLGGELPVLDMPADFPRPQTQSFEGGAASLTLTPQLTDALRQLAANSGTTLYMVLLAAYFALLSQYTGQDEIIVGTPVSGRRHADTEAAVGMFVNTLALRGRMQASQSFAELLQHVKALALAAFERQDYPFDELLDKLNPVRDLSRNPVFDTMFMFQNEAVQPSRAGALTYKIEEINPGISKFDFSLQVTKDPTDGETLQCTWEYAVRLFVPETIRLLAKRYIRILEVVSADPAVRLTGIDLLTDAEKERLLDAGNGADCPAVPEFTVQGLFEKQAFATPDRAAVVFDGQTVSYGELNRQANRLAHKLQALGAGPNTLIGICLDRSPSLPAALLAVLKSGGAYVPLDPSLPDERLRYMTERAELRVLVTVQAYAERLGGLRDLSVVCLDTEAGALLSQSDANPRSEADGEHLMYVIYTSGSTGMPKGASVYRSGFASLMRWYTGEFGMSAADKLLVITSPSFDLTQKNIFAPLLTGGQLILPPAGPYDARQIVSLIERHGITLLNGTPSAFYPLLDVSAPAQFAPLATLRHLFLGGEPIAADRLAPWLKSDACLAEVVNTYGPTECTDVTVFARLPAITALAGKRVPIGRPVPGTRVYILNAELGLVPAGTPGELCIAGAQVGGGYVGDPQQTAAKFVPNPYGGEQCPVIYRTGDLARFLPDGTIDYLGRIDHQVKVRGYRIEPGEIEAVLRHDIGAADAVVLAREVRPGDRQLIAYAVPRVSSKEAAMPPKALAALWRSELRRRLPEYMVPWPLVIMDAFPLTPNGKIDRSALPAPDVDLAERSGEGTEAPRTVMEARLAELWREVLGAEAVGIRDHFFEIGGHSLRAAALTARIHQALQVEVPMRMVFEHPTVESLAQAMEGLQLNPYAGIPAAGEQESYPVSSAQKRLYVLSQLETDGFGYNMPGVLHLEGEPDAARLEQAFRALIRRHEALRTAFTLRDGVPVQRIAPKEAPPEFTLPRIRVQGEAEALQAARAFIRPFDLEQAPLLRAALVDEGANRHRLLVDMHHIVSDGVSTAILLEELSRLYNGEGEGEALPELRIQYKDYAVWQQSEAGSERVRAQEAYWLERLKGELPVLDLPADRTRPAVFRYTGGVVRFTLGAERTSGLKRLALRTGSTLYMVLLAAYSTLLSKYSGQEEVIVGTPVAGRPHAELERVMGMFVNTLALRTYPSADKPFEAYVREVKELALEAYAHQDYPFEELVEKLNVRRDMSRNPLFDTMFAWQGEGGAVPELAGLKASAGEADYRSAKFDLTLDAEEQGDELLFRLEYCDALYERETAERMAGHFVQLIDAVLADPQAKLSALSMLTPEERTQVLESFNDTTCAYSSDDRMTIHGLLERQAARTPDRPAVVSGKRQWSYRELNERANRLARTLQAKGVGRESLVGILAERSPEMIAAALAVMKAGGAYVPIDPDYPEARIRYMLEDAGVSLLLAQSPLRNRVAFGGEWLLLDDPQSFSGDGSNLEGSVEPGDLAYVIYTSGTTGQPKGVLVEHAGVCNYKLFYDEALKVCEQDRVLQFASFSFDAACSEMTMSLFGGAALYVPDASVIADYRLLEQYVRDNGITVATLPPTYAAYLNPAHMPSLTRLITAGSASSPGLARRWSGFVRYFNNYGPTEDSICSTAWPYSTLDDTAKTVPIGRPIANHQVYILGADQSIMPVGIPGELCVSGIGLARGYLNRPELTAEKFVPVPFAPERRMYRTGDLARWLPDGNLEYMGRIDDQVKIRGYRIELGDVLTQLNRLPSVREALIVAHADKAGAVELCAYFTAEKTWSTGELRQALLQELPAYMVPTYAVQLAAFPLTPNGKIDRSALPAPDVDLAERSGEGTEAPRTVLEARLTELWREVLGAEAVGIRDHFFEIGGHSLRAAALTARIHQALQVEVPMRMVFEHPTVESLAQAMEELQPNPYEGIPAAGEQESYPVSSAQKRLYVLSQLETDGFGYNMPGVLHLEGEPDAARLEQAFRALIRRHEALRTAFTLHDGVPVQRIAPKEAPPEFTLPRIRVQGEAEALQAVRAFIRPFDLEQAPLLRAALVDEGANRHRLLVDMHHIVSDGVSTAILLEELSRLYNGEGEALPELRIQYKDYAVWQQSEAGSERVRAQEAYWLERLKGELPVLDLPADRTRPAVFRYTGGVVRFTLGAERTSGLKRLALRTGATLYMVLLAAYSTLLSKYSGQEEVIVGTPVAGRPHAELERVMGMFVNTLALRTYPSADKPFEAYVREVKELALEAYAHQDYPFEELVEKLNVRRDMSRNPLFDTMFAWQGEGGAVPELAGLKASADEADYRSAKFDLTLDAEEQGDELVFRLEYCDALYERETAERMAGHFVQLIDAALADPQAKLSALSMLTPEERSGLLDHFANAGLEAGPGMAGVFHEAFTAQAVRIPEQTAVVYRDERLSYRELDERSNRLARKLQACGVGRETLVGILAGRSPLLLVAVLAVWKAGGAYVPLDPDYPPERIRFMLEDSGASVLLTEAALEPRLEVILADNEAGTAVLALDDEAIYDDHGSDVAVINRPGDLAYLIYTSGTTGRPKGVMIEHQSLMNTAEGYRREYRLDQFPVRLLQLASFSFDVFVGDLARALYNGGMMVICPKDDRLDPNRLHHWIQAYEVNVFESTPALIVPFMQYAADRGLDLGTMKLLITSSDSCNVADYRALQERFGAQIRIINAYGVTEAAIDSSYYDQPLKRLPDAGHVPIGRPLLNARFYILDSQLRPVPVGVLGELCIGGAGVARGYWNLPDLTGEKFVPNPFVPGERLYRTGDSARWLPDGDVDFIGRLDDQVKIRGHRIELGEVEARLMKQSSILEAVVAGKESIHGQKQLCAYIVASGIISPGALRKELAEELPDYMIPSAWVQLDRLPLTPNGKVDRKALPAPNQEESPDAAYAAPHTKLQRTLTELWQKLLGAETIGIDDNFFERGGHSLTAIQLIAQAQTAGIPIGIHHIFQGQTIRKLSALLEQPAEVNIQLAETVQESERRLKQAFGLRSRFVTEESEDGLRVTLNMEPCHGVKVSELLAFIRAELAPNLHPHYLTTGESADDSFAEGRDAAIEQLVPLAISEKSPAEIKQRVKRELSRIQVLHEALQSDIIAGAVECRYALAPAQEYHLERPQCSGTVIRLDVLGLDTDRLSEAVRSLLARHSLLRSMLVRDGQDWMWEQRAVPEQLTLPAVDLSDCSMADQQELLGRLLPKLFTEPYRLSGRLLYRMALVRLNWREHWLLLPCSHLIYDETSGSILEGELLEAYRRLDSRSEEDLTAWPQLRTPGTEAGTTGMSADGYPAYVAQVRKGPQHIGDHELVQLFHLEDFDAGLELVNESIRAPLGQGYTKAELRCDMSEFKELASVNWGVWSLQLAGRFFRSYLQVAAVPVWMTHYGRHYENNAFFKTVGECIDQIPLLLTGTEADSESVREKIQTAAARNINFLNLVYNEQTASNYPKSRHLLRKGLDGIAIVYNHLGESEDAAYLFEETEAAGGDSYAQQPPVLHFTSQHQGSVWQISVTLPYREEKEAIIELLEKELQALAASLRSVKAPV
ncbi:amino acid adenylation domain-containing protein [Paenibacillus chitinolyticus]|uniref:amino acid adenylation domain-containing protein n=1 Tax=Paenibacillus chitinolyticus TaxID=79263 RepID=UPI0035E07809